MDVFLPILPERSTAPPVNELHALSLANHLVTLYTTNCITDISVRCGDETFDLHSPVLSHGSDYFRNVFTDDQSEITLEFTPSIESSTFRIIVESLYTGTVDGMTEKNVTSIVEASHHMGIKLVTDACVDFMLKHLDLDNCLEYWLSAKLCDNAKVKDEAIGLMGRHLEKISQLSQFLNLQSNTVIDIFMNDKLQVVSEVVVYEAAMAWIKYDPESREKELSSILQSIRLPLLPKRYLVNVVGKEDMIEENSDAMKKYSFALKSQLGGESKRISARHNAMHGMRGGYEKISKSIRHSIVPQRPSPARGVFSNCCDPEHEAARHDRFEEFRSTIASSASNISSGVHDGALKFGEGVQGTLSGRGIFSNCCDPEHEAARHDRFEEFRSTIASSASNISSGVHDGALKFGEGVQGTLSGRGIFSSCCDPEHEDARRERFEEFRSTIASNASNVSSGVQDGALKFGEGVQGTLSGRGIFSSCCDPENEAARHERFEEFRSTIASNTSNISSGVQDGALKFGDGVQGTLSGLGKSLKHLGDSISDPEMFNNLEKRNVGGFWLDVSDDVNKDKIDLNEQEIDVADVLQQSISAGDPLEEVPEVNEEDLSQGGNSFNMDGLSEDEKEGEKEDRLHNDEADENKLNVDDGHDNNESRVIGEDFLDLLDGPLSPSKKSSEDMIDLLNDPQSDDDGDDLRDGHGITFAA